jgi:hypothetical protein
MSRSKRNDCNAFFTEADPGIEHDAAEIDAGAFPSVDAAPRASARRPCVGF